MQDRSCLRREAFEMKSLSAHQVQILQKIDAVAEIMLDVSHQIHAHPELGYEEIFASGLLSQTLQDQGFDVEKGFAEIPTAFCARRGNRNGPRVAFLAEYDALPEIGHACGHNMIATSALAAGIGLGSVIDEVGGEVWVVGTPAEETDGSKAVMVKRGVFKGVDAALMIHPHENSYYLTESLALEALEVQFFGKASHAATAPWEGLNALDAMIQTFNSLNALRQQIHPDARIHGVIIKGGTAPNVIPDHTIGRFYLRAKSRRYVDELVGKFKACVQASAMATGTQFDVRVYENPFDEMVNNLSLAERMRDYFTQVLGSPPFQRTPDTFGSVDMGNVSHVVPSVHVLVDIAQGASLTPHTPEFQRAAVTGYADAAVIRSGKALALTGYDLLSDVDFMSRVRADFVAGLGTAGSATKPAAN